MELPDPILQRISLEKLVPLTWHPGGSLEQDLSFWTKSLETLVPDSIAHLLGGLGQLAQQGLFLHVSDEKSDGHDVDGKEMLDGLQSIYL